MYFRHLDANEYPGCKFYLGLYAEKGFKGSVDYDDAASCYYEGMEQGDGFCASNLGRMYALGIGVKKDEKLAFKLYEKSIELGDPLGYANLAHCYEVG